MEKRERYNCLIQVILKRKAAKSVKTIENTERKKSSKANLTFIHQQIETRQSRHAKIGWEVDFSEIQSQRRGCKRIVIQAQ